MAPRLFRATTRQSAPMNRSHRVVRASFYLSLALPFAALACGDSFTAGSGDGGDDGGGIVLGDGGGQDATTDGGGSDARHDGPVEGGIKHDGSMGDGSTCPPGSLMCAGGCVQEGPTNCGSCGNDCTLLPHVSNAQCISGQCSVSCAAGWSICSDAGAGCTTNTTVQGNCGGCGVTCSGNTAVCGGATGCVTGCTSSQIQCGSTCVLNVPDPASGVFVAQPGVGTTSCGAPSAPCSTITAGLNALVSGQNTVYVAEGTYLEQVTLPAGVTVSGGWIYQGAGWKRDCASPSKTIIQAPVGSDRVVIANASGPTATLDTLQIVNANTAAAGTSTQGGQTLYGIVATNAQSGQSSLSLTNVAISVADGGPGETGNQGLPGGAPTAGCTADSTANAGMNGQTPALGQGATGSGKYGPSGYLPQSGSQASMNGTDGHNGSAAPLKGQCQPVYPNSNTDNPNCCDDGSGAGCSACSGSLTPPGPCGAQGGPGCASKGSQAGYGGTGGGASIGIFTYNVAVSLSGVSINTGAGGKGGDGGQGGTVPPPLPPTTGASAKYVETCTNHCNSQTMTCTCFPATEGALLGSTGGDAGTGGTGGQGGGGAGGDSVCYATFGAGSVTPTSGLTCNQGAGGPGGNPGQSNVGAQGLSAASN